MLALTAHWCTGLVHGSLVRWPGALCPCSSRDKVEPPTAAGLPPRMADPAVHECVAQVATAQLPPHDQLTCALHTRRSTTHSRKPALSCFIVPPRMADPCSTRVRCTGRNSPTPPHDQLTCALHTRRGATHSRKPALSCFIVPPQMADPCST